MKTAIVIGAIILGGAAVGLALERTGFYSPIGEPTVAEGLYEVPFYFCPGEDAMGEVHGGDRVFITGKTADAGWLELRAPNNVQGRVWVESRYITEDSDLGGIPETDCEIPVAETATTTTSTSEPTTTTSTSEPTTTTSTSESATTTSTSEPTTTTSTSEPTTTTSTSEPTTTTSTSEPTTTTSTTQPPPVDDEGPIINFFQADQSKLWEDGIPCSGNPRTMNVGGYVFDPSGVQSVWISWDVGNQRGTRMAVEPNPGDYPGFFFAEIGPFPTDTLTGGDAPIWLEIKAYDDTPDRNRTTVASTSLTVLHDCTIG